VETRQLRYTGGDSYRGWDQEGQCPVKVRAGEAVTVSATTATDLLNDFPNLWEDKGPGPQASAPDEPPLPAEAPNIIYLPKPQGRRRP